MKFKTLLVILFAVGSVALGEINLKVGDPESQVMAALGEPQGKAVKNGATLYMYEGGTVTVKAGKVIDFPKNYEAAIQQKQIKREAARLEKLKQEEIAATQKAKGLVLYDGQWVTPQKKDQLEADARPKLLLLSSGWRKEAGYAIVEGEVKNISDKPLQNIEIVVGFFTDDDRLISSADSLIEFNPILSGQKSPFRTSVPYNPAMAGVKIDFKELMGGTINWEKK
jgi:hypothetical protein